MTCTKPSHLVPSMLRLNQLEDFCRIEEVPFITSISPSSGIRLWISENPARPAAISFVYSALQLIAKNSCLQAIHMPSCLFASWCSSDSWVLLCSDSLAGRGCKCFVVAALAGRPAAGLGAVKSAMFTGQIIRPVNMRHGKNKENIRLNNLYPNIMSQTQNMWVLWDIVRLSVFCALWGVCY